MLPEKKRAARFGVRLTALRNESLKYQFPDLVFSALNIVRTPAETYGAEIPVHLRPVRKIFFEIRRDVSMPVPRSLEPPHSFL